MEMSSTKCWLEGSEVWVENVCPQTFWLPDSARGAGFSCRWPYSGSCQVSTGRMITGSPVASV